MEIINQTYHSTIRLYKKLHKYISSMADSYISGTGTIMEQQTIEIFRFKASAHTCVGHSLSALSCPLSKYFCLVLCHRSLFSMDKDKNLLYPLVWSCLNSDFLSQIREWEEKAVWSLFPNSLPTEAAGVSTGVTLPRTADPAQTPSGCPLQPLHTCGEEQLPTFISPGLTHLPWQFTIVSKNLSFHHLD